MKIPPEENFVSKWFAFAENQNPIIKKGLGHPVVQSCIL
jgi:hypothetical protein